MNDIESTTIMYPTKCGRCGEEFQAVMTISTCETGEESDDGKQIVEMSISNMEILDGCEHALWVRDNCEIRMVLA